MIAIFGNFQQLFQTISDVEVKRIFSQKNCVFYVFGSAIVISMKKGHFK